MYEWQQFEIKLVRKARKSRSKAQVTSIASLARVFRQHAEEVDHESIWIAAFDAAKRLIGIQELYRGTSTTCTVGIAEVFRFPIVLNATSFALVHNHPSGAVTPSEPDLALTKDVYRLANELQLDFFDSLVIGARGNYRSMRQSLMDSADPIWHQHLFPGTCAELGEHCSHQEISLEQTA